jgi:nucleoside 2-deoxyribosyltransferase
MAFGQKDTDAIFRALRKTLGPLGVNAQRVDRIEHNDKIDTRIISEIEAADLVIADLTYARPSVYFEAGYAQRATPVIFTARSDHFRERDDDPNGNRHVHFDLKMRNIIAWSSPNDSAFLGRLTRRVTKVIAPLVRSRVASQAAKERCSAFERLSTVDKGRALFDTAWSHFKRARTGSSIFAAGRVRTFRPKHSRSIHRCATVRLLRRSELAEDSSSCFVKPCWLCRRICAKHTRTAS